MRWKLWIGFGLVVLSATIYVAEVLIFHDARATLFYMVQDIAFLPVSALLVAVVLTEVMTWRDRTVKLEKMNMVIGAFFSETGGELLRRLTVFDASSGELGDSLRLGDDWKDADFAAARRRLDAHRFALDVRRGDLFELRDALTAHRGFILSLLQNPNLFEHETFSELLWAVLHVSEELTMNSELPYTHPADIEHLATDMERAYRLLIGAWLGYMAHLSKAFPYLYSLGVRTNPFGGAAGA